MDSGHPSLDGFLATFAIHDARTTPASEERIAVQLAGRFAKVCDLFAGGDVVSPDQSVKESH